MPIKKQTESQVVLFYSDVDRILRALYAGGRPEQIRFLICSCGSLADLRRSDVQAIGWQLLPHVQCQECRVHPYLGPARERYQLLVEQLAAD